MKRSPGPAQPSGTADRFFIPDLCAPQAVFLAVLLAELVVLLHVLALGPLSQFAWRTFALASLFVQWNTLLCIALICFLRTRLQRLRPALAGLGCLLIVFVVAVLSSFLAVLVYPSGAVAPPLPDLVARNALLAVTLAAIVLRYSYLQQRVAMQQRSALQLRLDALRARIRPHFLFNTLNSIASLISLQPERAEQAIEDVAELFRAALQADRQDSRFADEQHLCSLYLDLETLRLGDRLQVAWDVEEGVEGLPVPALLLQPLVENAVYHGVSQMPEGGRVTVSARREGAGLRIEIENPLPVSPARPAGSGQHMALDNVRQRLHAQYGERAGLTAEERDGVYRAILRLPIDREDLS
jgi:two-component system sensor histidine kinase AlgZ